MNEDPLPLTPPRSPQAMFVALSLLALQAFGGALAFAHDMMVERRRWLTRNQFLEMMALAQLLPGPNMANLALLVGDHFFGWRGALACIAGLLSAPLVIALSVAALFGGFIASPRVAGALAGVGAVAAGLIIGQALRLAGSLRQSPIGRPLAWMLASLAFLAAAGLHLPLHWVIPVLATVGWLIAGWRLARPGDPAERR
ncbi:MAG: chromate transporter [Burkholderiaceae bacterium]